MKIHNLKNLWNFLFLLIGFFLLFALASTVDAQTPNPSNLGPEEAEKVWVGLEGDPPTIYFTLMRRVGDEEYEKVPGPNNPQLVPKVPDAAGKYMVYWQDVEQSRAPSINYTFKVIETDEAGNPTPEGYTKQEVSMQVTNTRIVTLKVRKEWANNGPRTDVSFQFYASPVGGTSTPAPTPAPVVGGILTLTAANAVPTGSNTWEGTIQLPAVDGTGRSLFYTVEEVSVPPNYSASRPENCRVPGTTNDKDPNCWIIKNTYEPTPVATVDFTVYKKWSANSPAQKPNVTFVLYRKLGLEGIRQPMTQYFGDKTLAGGNTSVTWSNLPKTDPEGETYYYSFEELAIPLYTSVKDDDGHTITNTYVPPKINITVNKYWTGNQYPRPVITINLYRNGVEQSSVTLSNTSSATWNGLEQYDANGNAYVYTVDEPNVPTGYSKTVSGFTITNTYVGPAYTGDDRSARTYAAILGTSLLGIGLLLYLNKRRGQAQP